ncbi:adenylosuccinate lyase [Stetteria hydrogenophila]
MDPRSVCVLDWRYGSEEVRRLFRPDSMVKRYILVEKALVKGLAEAGLAPRECAELIDRCADDITPGEVYELEKKTGHDISSLAYLMGKRCGECGRYVHLGATSYDIVDTAWALALRDALSIIKSKLRSVVEALVDLALKYRDLVMPGRTHGQHALPITLGFKLANYAYELARSYERLCGAEERVVLGKMAGAVGTMAAWGGRGLLVEEKTLGILGLKPHRITTQVAPRDGFAELVSALAIMGSQLDRLALEVRELSRPEIGELYEAVERVGSSTMPHKRNPVTAERISGLARVLRSLTVAALENIVLMHERDLTNSSSERILIPHAILVADQMLEDTRFLLSHLGVDPEAARRNLELTRGLIMSEAVMVKLVEKGVPRHEAHRRLVEISRRAAAEGKTLAQALLEDELASKLLSREEVEELMDPSKYLGSYDALIRRAVDYARSAVSKC